MNAAKVYTGLSAALSSISTSGILLVAPFVLNGAAYGELSLAVMVTMFLAAAINGLLGEVLLSLGKEKAGALQCYADASAWLLAVLASLLCLGAGGGLLWVGSYSTATVLLNCGLTIAPILLVMHRRTSLLAVGKHSHAFALDTIWLVGWILLFAFAWLVMPSAHLDSTLVSLTWSLPAVVAYLAVSGQRLSISFHGSRSWFTEWGRLGGSITGGNIMYSSGALIAASAVAGVLGMVHVGGLRFAQTVYGLGRVIFNAARLYYIPQLASGGVRLGPLVQMSLLLTLIPIFSFIVLHATLQSYSGLLDGDIRSAVEQCLVPVGVASIGAAMAQGPLVGLRALQASLHLFIFRASGGAMLVIFSGAALAWGGRLVEVAWGLAFGEVLMSVLGWVLLTKTLRRRGAGGH